VTWNERRVSLQNKTGSYETKTPRQDKLHHGVTQLVYIDWEGIFITSVSSCEYAYLQCDYSLFVLHRNCMCAPLFLCTCVSMCIHALWQCIHVLLGKEEGMNKQRDGRLAWRLCVCVCVCVTVKGNNQRLPYVLCWCTFRGCFVFLGGHNSRWWLSCVGKTCSLPPARHINHCLPRWVTLHHTNKHPTKYFLTQIIANFSGRYNKNKYSQNIDSVV